VDEVAEPDGVGGAEQGGAVGVEGEAVAAGEDGQGAEGIEAGGEAGEAVSTTVTTVVFSCLPDLMSLPD
jgi:hypothetical protein